MRVLGSAVQALVLSVLDGRHHLAFGRAVTGQLVRDQVLSRIPRMKRHPASSANQFISLYQAPTMNQVAEFRRTRRVKEGIGTLPSVSAAFGPAGPIYLGNPGLVRLRHKPN